MKWTQCSMREAIEFCEDRIISDEKPPRPWPNPDCEVVMFTEGTAVAVLSKWRGIVTEVILEFKAEPPLWWIGEEE